MEKEKIGYKVILRQKEFMKEVLALIINRFGDSVDAIASTWIVYELTGSAVWSALIFGVNKLPTVIITPFAGAWVEGRKKKTIMVMTDLIRALCVGVVATGYLLGFLQSWMLLITTFVISTAEAFRGPASTALTPKLLEEKYYDYGLSLSSSLSSVVELVGTALAAGIIAAIGTSGAIYVDMVTFILSALIIMTINTKENAMVQRKFDRKEYMETLKAGLNYTMHKKEVLLFCVIALFLNAILVPVNSLQAPMISEILKDGATALSIMGVTVTVSMILGSVTYPMIREKISGRLLFILSGASMAIFYIGVVAFGPLYSSKIVTYAILVVLCFLLGYSVALASAFASVEFIKQIDDDYLARTGAIFSAMSVAVTPIVSFVVSIVAGFVSTAVIFVASGVCAVIATILMGVNQTLRNMD